MNLKVIKRYVDRFTKEIIEVGTILKDVSEKRAEELVDAKVAEEIPVEKAEKPKKQKAEKKEPENEALEAEETPAE